MRNYNETNNSYDCNDCHTIYRDDFLLYAQRQQAVRADQPSITGQYGITIDADTGEILYGKREDERSYPASIAKMMTTLLY